MKALLVRVGCDQTKRGGRWNSPVEKKNGDFVYIPIPEAARIQSGLEKPYMTLSNALKRLGRSLPTHLQNRNMHLDPDFEYLTYGDGRQRALQIRSKLVKGDLLVFYAAFADVRTIRPLVYAIIGIYEIESIQSAISVPKKQWHENAHSRRKLAQNADDIVVHGRPTTSGRLQRCITIGEYRDRAYRVKKPLLEAWGGLSVKNGWLQRSARLPEFLDPPQFYRWFKRQNPILMKSNN